MKKAYFIVPLFLQKLIWIPARFFFKFFGHIEIRGLENLKGIKTNVIFACNHTSELDPIFIPAVLPFFSRFSPMFYTSREQSFYNNSGWRQFFYGGLFFKAWGAYPVCVGLNDYAKSTANHVEIVNDGGNLCIFPEGSKTKDGSIGQGKGGVAYIANTTGRPIVPVKITGAFKLRAADAWRRRAKLGITFGAPLYVTLPTNEPVGPESFKAQSAKVMEVIRNL